MTISHLLPMTTAPGNENKIFCECLQHPKDEAHKMGLRIFAAGIVWTTISVATVVFVNIVPNLQGREKNHLEVFLSGIGAIHVILGSTISAVAADLLCSIKKASAE